MQELLKTVIDHLPPLSRPVAFEPIESDGDELTRAIENDIHAHDNDWQLKEAPDPVQLEAFWDNVLNDLGADTVDEDLETLAND